MKPKLFKEILTDNLLKNQISKEMLKEKMLETENSNHKYLKETPDLETLRIKFWLQEKNKTISDLATTTSLRETKTWNLKLMLFNLIAMFWTVKTKTSIMNLRDSCKQTNKSELLWIEEKLLESSEIEHKLRLPSHNMS